MENKPLILFETEGSYPYSGGGVSTWSHILCTELEDKVDFIIMALTGGPFVESRYRLTSNIRSIIHVPLWGTEEPMTHFDKETPFSKQVERKARTNQKVVKEIFLPMFRDFVLRVLDPSQPAKESGELIYGFWKFYRHYDYKKTLSNPLVWTTFKRLLQNEYKPEEDLWEQEHARMLDVTFGMRWLYHFMMPLAVPLPDVTATHSTLAGFPAITSIAAKYEHGTPMILTDHGVFIRERLINVSQVDMSYFSKKLLIDLATFVTRAVYHNADVLSPVTSINAKWETQFEASESNIQPIYNGVNTDVFRPRPKPKKTRGKPTVVAAAQVFQLKDIETMIYSCDVVRREIPDVQYILYGSLEVDKEYAEKCQNLVEKLELEEHFTFGGFHEMPSMLYNEGDITILSSISEGFPYTVIESMSCGRPVVATDVGGVSEAIKNSGILCKPRDPKDLAEGVIKLLNNDQLRIRLGKEARERVLLNYTINKSVNSYHDIYKQFHQKKKQPLYDTVQLKSVRKMLNHLEVNV